MGPRKRLTASRIESLEPRASRYEVTDPACAGLQLRVEPTGAKIWQFRFYWQGRRVKLPLGAWDGSKGVTLADAHEKAGAARSLLNDGIDPRRAGLVGRHRKPTGRTDSKGTAPHSVALLASEFMARYISPHRRRPEYVQAILDRDVLPTWRDRDARTITPREVVELLDGIVARGSPVQANRTAAVLTQLFKFGIHRQIVDDSPVKLLMRPGGRERARSRAFTDAEIGAFLENLDEVMRSPRTAHALRILLLTGQRRGELALARWRDVELEASTWRIPAENTKTGAERTLPLSPAAVREFRALKKLAKTSAFVFATDDGAAPADAKLITRSVARCSNRFEAIGVAPFVVHDLRRTLRTGLARLKVRADVAERVLGHVHRDPMIATYDTHDYAKEIRAALIKWAKHVEGLKP